MKNRYAQFSGLELQIFHQALKDRAEVLEVSDAADADEERDACLELRDECYDSIRAKERSG
jgi:hypothetical protein